ncbi:MAG: hypothetical protein IJP17_00995, partial [Clostridia bacterium]|nr:hypothetical protein [Clostridia bacterium]
MAKLKMQKIRIIAMRERRKAVLERLQRIGMLEPEQIAPDDILRSVDTSQQRAIFENTLRTINDALAAIDKYSPEKSSLLSSFSARADISEEEYSAVIEQRDENLRLCEGVVRRRKRIDELKAENVRLQTRIDSLVPWLSLDIPMTVRETDRAAVIIGTLPSQTDREGVLSGIAAQCPDVDGIEVETVGSGAEMTCIVVICLKEDRDAVEGALRSMGLARPLEISKAPPRECSATLQGRIDERLCEIAKLEGEIAQAAEKRTQIKYLSDYFTMRLEKYRIIEQLGSGDSVFVIEGWTTEESCRAISDAVQELGGYCECIEAGEDEEPPVVLRNNRFTEGGEPVVSMFALPSKRDVDPTGIMAIFYYILFGLMLGDAAYGLIMVAATLFVLLKLKPEAGQRKSMKLFLFSGVSAVIWGFVFGSFFGDLPNVIAKSFFGATENVFTPLWFDPITNPMTMMYFSLGVGIVHIVSGLVMGIITALRNKDVVAAISDYGSWLLLLLSIIGLALPMLLGDSLPFALPPVTSKIFLELIVAAVLIIIFMTGRESRSPVKRVLKGAYNLYGATSYLSDVLSYSRLLALGLATGVISQVVN